MADEEQRGVPVVVQINEWSDRALLVETYGIVSGIDVRLDAFEERLDAHELILDGPPENGNKPGLKTRVDRNTRSIRRLHAGLAAAAGLVIDFVWRMVRGG